MVSRYNYLTRHECNGNMSAMREGFRRLRSMGQKEKEEFEKQRRGRSFKIVFKRDEIIDKISETYADVNESEKLALFNSAVYLEIAINKGNSECLFGLQGYTENLNAPSK